MTYTVSIMWQAFLYALVPLTAAALSVATVTEVMARLGGLGRQDGRLLLFFIFGQLGMFVGFYSGNSREAVTAAAFSTLGSLVTLAFGWVFGKDRIPLQWQKAIPYAVVSLLLATTFSMSWGSINRRANEAADRASSAPASSGTR